MLRSAWMYILSARMLTAVIRIDTAYLFPHLPNTLTSLELNSDLVKWAMYNSRVERYTRMTLQRTPRRSPLGDFIAQEMKLRNDMSARQFAELVDVAPGTINAYINGKDITPTFDFLEKLSSKTGIDLCTLVALAFPRAKTQPNPEALILMERYLRLPENVRQVIQTLVLKE